MSGGQVVRVLKVDNSCNFANSCANLLSKDLNLCFFCVPVTPWASAGGIFGQFLFKIQTN